MKAHGTQTRASGDPYFSHPLEVRGEPDQTSSSDDATIVPAPAAPHLEDTEATSREIDNIFGTRSAASRRAHQGWSWLGEQVSHEAKQAENLPQAAARKIARRRSAAAIKLADPCKHAPAGVRAAPLRAAHREETLDIYAPLAGRMGMQECGRARGSLLPYARTGSLMPW